MRLHRSLFALALGMTLGATLTIRPHQPPSAPSSPPAIQAIALHDSVSLGFNYACSHGDERACVEVAQRLAAADPRNESEARRILEQSCARGYGEACDALARALDDASAFSWQQDRARALLYFVEGCERGFGDACTEAGKRSLDGDIVSVDQEAAAATFKRGCTLGSPESCLYELVALGKLADASLASAKAMPEGSGCGPTMAHNRDLVTFARAARKNMPRACSLGLENACGERAYSYHNTRQIAADTLCERGHLSACSRAGKRDPFAPPAALITGEE
jgi:hypothetical protein